MPDPPRDERGAIAWISALAPTPPEGEIWIGDDTAVVHVASGTVLFATDSVVQGVHVLDGPEYLGDAGWKALVRNLSDVAAMGGVPTHAVAAVSGASGAALGAIHEGLTAASEIFACPIVGGDLSAGSSIVITVAILGHVDPPGPVLRSGARPGDGLFLTGPLGASSAGLRQLREDPVATGAIVDAHRRPVPRLREGSAALSGGATAMIDISDGLGIDLHRLADASGVGFTLEAVPVAHGATETDARSGGDDYALLFSAPDAEAVDAAFAALDLDRPVRIGTVQLDSATRTFRGDVFGAEGWQHENAPDASAGGYFFA